MREGSKRSQGDRVRPNRQRHHLARSLRCASNKCEPNPVGVKIKGLGGVKPKKFFQKALDKLSKVCYNNNVKRSEAILINLIRNSGRDGEEQEHAGWLTV